MMYPVYSNLDDNSNSTAIVGAVIAVLPWDVFLADLLPQGVSGVVAEIMPWNSTQSPHSYLLRGDQVRRYNGRNERSTTSKLSLTYTFFSSGHSD